MEKILTGLAMEIKEVLINENFFEPTLFWLNQGKLIMAKPMIEVSEDDVHEKISKNTWLAGVIAKKVKADLVVVTVNGAFREIDPKDISSIDITEDPTTYPRSMRFEVILLMGMGLPSGKKLSMALPYKGGEGTPVEFFPEEPLNVIDEDELVSQLSEVAQIGWEVSDNIPIDDDLEEL